MRYMESELECIKLHDEFDVLGHLTYVCKSPNNPFHAPLEYSSCREIADEIMRFLISHGKGIEINTSGVDKGVDFIPNFEYVRRFKELGGEIITVGSDSHDAVRVGQYCHQVVDALKDIFGYVGRDCPTTVAYLNADLLIGGNMRAHLNPLHPFT